MSRKYLLLLLLLFFSISSSLAIFIATRSIPVYLYVGSDTTGPYIGSPLQEPNASAVMPNQNVTVFVNVTDNESGVRDVILSYNNGTTWRNETMAGPIGDTYSAEILGFQAGTSVQYKIIAYDKVGNASVKSPYYYTVIPEFSTQTSILLILMVLTATIILHTRRLHDVL